VNFADLLTDNARPQRIATMKGLLSPRHFLFERTQNDMLAYNTANSDWCRDNFGHDKRWGFGNLHCGEDGKLCQAYKRDVIRRNAT